MFLRPYEVDPSLQLEVLRPEHLYPHFTLINQYRDHIGAWESWAQQTTLEDQRAYLERKLEEYIRGEGFAAGIWVRETPDQPLELVGNLSCSIQRWQQSAEIGYWLIAPMTGRGIVTRVARVVIDHLLLELGLGRVQICVTEGNFPSRRVAERLGFHLDGILRRETLLNGQWMNRAIYSMLREEWLTQS
ncbi:MAG: GNAT family N-acetyltransferase [Anaerolineae bacterium]|jgi:RimJ/RimL family protein N-acetyltransferase|nr:GNAT family N-acetyltransferase [Anaerolineae bacterium]